MSELRRASQRSPCWTPWLSGGVADEDAEVPPQIRIAVPAFQRIAAEIREARDE